MGQFLIILLILGFFDLWLPGFFFACKAVKAALTPNHAIDKAKKSEERAGALRAWILIFGIISIQLVAVIVCQTHHW